MSKGRQRTREKRARKYFKGGTMPDGLELFPLDGGKLEVMQEIIESGESDEMDDASLGGAMLYMYANRYAQLRDMSLDEIAEAGTELGRSVTLEDRQAAEEVILSDFDALGASMTQNPKQTALVEEGPSHSLIPVTSGPGSNLAIVEMNSTEPAPSRSSKSTLPANTQTGETATRGNGSTRTLENSRRSGKNSNASAPVTNG
jgi:hypothetical protein